MAVLVHGSLLLLEALFERPPEARTPEDWQAIGRTLATLHKVHGEWFGLDGFSTKAVAPPRRTLPAVIQ